MELGSLSPHMYSKGSTKAEKVMLGSNMVWSKWYINKNDNVSPSVNFSADSGFDFSPDGTKVYSMDTADDSVKGYTLSIPWDTHSTIGYIGTYNLPATGESNLDGIAFSSDGKRFIIGGSSNDVLLQFSVGTAWDITTASFDGSTSISAQVSDITDVTFSKGGTKLYVYKTNEDIYQYNLSTPFYTLTGRTYTGKLVTTDVPSATYFPAGGLDFSDDGTVLYITTVSNAGSSDPGVYMYKLSTPWDVTTGTFMRREAFDISVGPSLFRIATDASKMFVGVSNGYLSEFTVN